MTVFFVVTAAGTAIIFYALGTVMPKTGSPATKVAQPNLSLPSSQIGSPTDNEGKETAPSVHKNVLSEVVPESSGDLLHPYQLLANPFMDKGKMVILNILPIPLLSNGTLAEYQTLDPRIATVSGIKGLRFNRMLSQSIGLYDIMAVELPGSQDPQMVGQLAVMIRSGSTAPGDTLSWNAEPLGTLDGTNSFGAPIQIPYVCFWGYAGASTSAMVAKKAPELSGDASTAVNFVKSNVEPTGALLTLNPDLQNIDWNAVNDSFVCNGCWFVSAHIRKDKDSTEPVQYYVNPGWNVNIVQRTIKPDADGLKFYTLKVPTAH